MGRQAFPGREHAKKLQAWRAHERTDVDNSHLLQRGDAVSSRLAPLMEMRKVVAVQVRAPAARAETQPAWTKESTSGRSALRRKLLLFRVAIAKGYAWLALIAILNSVASLYYYLRVIGPSYFEPAEGPVAVLGRLTLGTALATGAAVLGLGLAAEPLLRAFGR